MVRVNAGGDAPPDPPSVGDVTGCHGPFPLSLFSSRTVFWRMSEKIFLATTVEVCRCIARILRVPLVARESVTDRFGGRSIP